MMTECVLSMRSDISYDKFTSVYYRVFFAKQEYESPISISQIGAEL
jgi:hypothetical protein